MTTYVINPITNELESAQLRQKVGDKFKLQTFVRDQFVTGGSVETPKRGLVDEPGSYAGKGRRALLTQNEKKNCCKLAKKDRG